MNTKTTTVPEGFIAGPHGTLHPIDNVQPADLARDKLVRGLLEGAHSLSGVMGNYRTDAMREIESFVAKAEKKFGVKHGGDKGNLTLLSFDGREKVVVQIGSQYVFNEKFGIAQKLIYQCLDAWTEGANKNIVAVIQDAFKKDDDGNAIPARIMGLKKLKINDTVWRRAMKALDESVQISARKPYLRFYRKDDHEEWVHVALDMAKIPAEAA